MKTITLVGLIYLITYFYMTNYIFCFIVDNYLLDFGYDYSIHYLSFHLKMYVYNYFYEKIFGSNDEIKLVGDYEMVDNDSISDFELVEFTK